MRFFIGKATPKKWVTRNNLSRNQGIPLGQNTHNKQLLVKKMSIFKKHVPFLNIQWKHCLLVDLTPIDLSILKKNQCHLFVTTFLWTYTLSNKWAHLLTLEHDEFVFLRPFLSQTLTVGGPTIQTDKSRNPESPLFRKVKKV